MLSNDTLVHLMDSYGIFIIFFLAIFEGPIVAVIAGYLIRIGHFDWVSVTSVLVIADLTGDSILYWIGSQGHHSAITRWRKKAGLSDERLKKLQTQFSDRGGWIVLFGKITHAPGMAILLAAGMSRMNYGKFILFNLIGTVPKALLFMAAGYMLGAAFSKVESYLLDYSLVFAGFAFAIFLLYRQFRQTKGQAE